jgi:hypothetical protein
MAKAAFATVTLVKLVNNSELCLYHWQNHQLCKPLTNLYAELLAASVPAGDKQLTLVIGINQADQVPEHDTVLVAQPRARQYHSSKTGIANVDGYAGRNQPGVTWRQQHGLSSIARRSMPADPGVA